MSDKEQETDNPRKTVDDGLALDMLCTIYVNGLPRHVEDDALAELFSPHGKVNTPF